MDPAIERVNDIKKWGEIARRFGSAGSFQVASAEDVLP